MPRSRGSEPTPTSTSCSRLDARRRELLPEVEGAARRAQRGFRRDRRGQARGPRRGCGDRGDARGLGRGSRRSRAELAEVEAERERLALTIPNPPDPDAPDGDSEEDAVAAARGGRAAAVRLRGPRTTSRSGSTLGLIDMEKAAEASGSRFAYLLGDLVLRRARAGPLRGRARRRATGFTPVVPPVLVREEAAVRHRLLPRRAGDDLRGAEGRALPRRHLRGLARGAARGGDPRRRRAADPLRGHLDLLPPRGRRRRQGHARHLPRPPVRQGRDVLVRRARGRRRPSTSGCSRSRRGSSPRSRSPTGSSTSRSATSAPRPPASSTARPGSRARSATARSPRARTPPTTRRAASTAASATARAAARSRQHPERHRRRRRAARSSP